MFLSPDWVVESQERLGANLIMPLDECLGPEATRTEAEGALGRTQRWWREVSPPTDEMTRPCLC